MPMTVKCHVETKARVEIFGFCNDKNLCIFEGTSRPGQFSYKCVMTNKDGSERKSVNKRKFLATLYNFLGGLGNALKFIYIKFSLL